MSIDFLFADFDRLIQSAESVHRLRRFILDLAVRGKLSPQDPNDEPASELLKRIAAEKARLVKAGAIGKPKQLPAIDEPPYPIPDSWRWLPIRAATSDRAQCVPQTAFTYIDVTAIDKEKGFIAKPKVLQANEAPSRARKIVRKGDVVYSCVRPYLLNVAVVGEDFDPLPIASTAFAVLYGHGLVLPWFQWIVLRSPFMVTRVEEEMRGQAYPAINDSDFARLPFPLPPLAEQHRIVAKVDELMALCDRLEAARADREATRDRLASASFARLNAPDPDPATFQNDVAFALNNLTPLTTRPDQIKALRQTILNLAVSGKLVPQDPNDEPTSELLKRIAAEKARLVKLGKLRAQKSFPPFATYSSPEIPSGWRLSYLGDVIKLSNGFAFKSEDFHSRGIPVIRIGDLRGGKVDLSNAVCVSEKTAESVGQEIWIPGGALLIAMSGATTGKVAFNKTGQKLLLNQRVGRIETFLTSANFVKFFFETIIARNLEISFGTAIPNLSAKQINETVIPLPPVAEQHRIVAKVDELMTLCDRLEVSLVTAEETLSRLLIALLDEALRGNKTTNFPLPDIRLCRNRNENS